MKDSNIVSFYIYTYIYIYIYILQITFILVIAMLNFQQTLLQSSMLHDTSEVSLRC